MLQITNQTPADCALSFTFIYFPLYYFILFVYSGFVLFLDWFGLSFTENLLEK